MGLKKLQNLSSGLGFDNKTELFNENQKYGASSLLDFVIPSMGNWIEGDTTGAIVNLSGLAVACVMFACANISVSQADQAIPFNYETILSTANTANTINIVGWLIIVASDIYGFISGLNYANSFNKNLSEGLESYNNPINFNNYLSSQQSQRYLNGWTENYCINLVNIRF